MKESRGGKRRGGERKEEERRGDERGGEGRGGEERSKYIQHMVRPTTQSSCDMAQLHGAVPVFSLQRDLSRSFQGSQSSRLGSVNS